MGQRGPLPKPASQQHRKQSPRALRVLTPGEKPSGKPPKPPDGIGIEARRVWRAFWRSAISQAVDPDADMHRLRRWMQAVDQYERVLAAFEAEMVVRGSHSMVLNPLAHRLARLEGEIGRAEVNLGLTPIARLRLGITFGQAQITAATLTKTLEDHAERNAPDAIEAEWEPA